MAFCGMPPAALATNDALRQQAQEEAVRHGLLVNMTHSSWRMLCKSASPPDQARKANGWIMAFLHVGRPLPRLVPVRLQLGSSLKDSLFQALRTAGLPRSAEKEIQFWLDGKGLKDCSVGSQRRDARIEILFRGCLGGVRKNAQHCKETRAKAKAKADARAAAGSRSLAAMFGQPPASSNAESSAASGQALKQDGHVQQRAAADKKRDYYDLHKDEITEARRQRYEQNPNKEKAARMERYETDPETERAARMERYEADPETERAARMERYEADPETERAARRERYETDPEKENKAKRDKYAAQKQAKAAAVAVADERRKKEVKDSWSHAEQWAEGCQLPPCFACLQDATCHRWIQDLYGFFEDCSLKQCSECKERWFDVPQQETSFGNAFKETNEKLPWYRAFFKACLRGSYAVLQGGSKKT